MAKNSDRRRFLRKVFGLTAMAGIAGILSDRILGNEILPPVQAVTAMNIDTTNTGAATTSLSSPGNPAFTATNTGSGAALQGTATAGTGVLGTTTTGTGVQGTASGTAGIGLSGFAGNAAATPIVAQGSTGQTANLQEWRDSTGKVLASISPAGTFSIVSGAQDALLFNGTAAEMAKITNNAGEGGLTYILIGATGGQGVFGHTYSATDANRYAWVAVSGDNPAAGTGLIVKKGGYVGIGTTSPAYPLDVAGQVHATGFPTSSDMRFKSDIQPIDNALDKVLRLNGVYFKWNHLHRDVLKRSNTTAKQVGLIAQQVKEVIPEIVSEWSDQGADDYLAVDYSRLVAIMIEAMKELKTENSKLLHRITTLERAIGFPL